MRGAAGESPGCSCTVLRAIGGCHVLGSAALVTALDLASIAACCHRVPQAFLREGSLAVGESTVIRQAQVTALADTKCELLL